MELEPTLASPWKKMALDPTPVPLEMMQQDPKSACLEVMAVELTLASLEKPMEPTPNSAPLETASASSEAMMEPVFASLGKVMGLRPTSAPLETTQPELTRASLAKEGTSTAAALPATKSAYSGSSRLWH